jgi:ketosteroid isomerase-like protein
MMPAFEAAGNPFLTAGGEDFVRAPRRRFIALRSVPLLASLFLAPAAEVLAQAAADSARAQPAAGQAAAERTPIQSLVDTERAFSANSVEKGMRDAFLAYLADDAILFRPLPVEGKKIWEARAPNPATLIWEPAYAEVSSAGDLGVTTGPWEFRPPPDSTGAPAPDKIAYGHFVTVWKKQTDGRWRVAVDIGVNHDKPERGVGNGDLTLGPPDETGANGSPSDGGGSGKSKAKGATSGARVKPGKAPARVDLAAFDRAYSRAAASRGIPDAFVDRATSDVRLNREGVMPAMGLAAARASLDTLKGGMTWRTQGSGLSASGDLGYTYGVGELRVYSKAPADSSVYLHVWRKAPQGWRLSLAVENPIPKRR